MLKLEDLSETQRQMVDAFSKQWHGLDPKIILEVVDAVADIPMVDDRFRMEAMKVLNRHGVQVHLRSEVERGVIE